MRQTAGSCTEQLPEFDAGLVGVSVLVVDDDEDTREALKETLAFLGADVNVASSAEGARAAMARRCPDVIVSDINMPAEDGLSFILGIRRGEATSGGHVAAVALSAQGSDAARTRAIEAGYDSFIAKPYGLTDLELTLTRLLALRAIA